MKIVLKNRKIVFFIVTMQEAFSAIIPFFLLTSLLSLVYIIVIFYKIDILFLNRYDLGLLIERFQFFSSIIANVSIAYFFALRFKISQIISISLSIATFSTILLLEHPYKDIIMPYGFDITTLINPIISTYFLKLLYPKLSLKIELKDGHHHVYRLFNYLFVFIFAYILTIFLYWIADYFCNYLITHIEKIDLNIPNIALFAIRDFFIQLFWFFGLHGSHMVNALIGKELLFKTVMPNLTFGEFNRLFVVIGGAGVGFSLLVALLIYAKDKSLRFVTKISAPFTLFNINTLLIYMVVVFNRFFIIPFIFLPLANLIIAYFAIIFLDLHFTHFYLNWMTPVFVDSFLKVQEYQKAMLLQFFLLIFDTTIYIYFAKKFFTSQSSESHFQMLVKNLDIADEIKAQEGLKSFVKRQEIIEANAQLDTIINSINNQDLIVYYQPKVDPKTKKCDKFEALIRYYKNGKLTGPSFLDIVEKAGLAHAIDIYVCKRVKKDILSWKEKDFHPQIGVNLHPDTLKNSDAINKIIEILRGEKITFEIIERSFLKKRAEKNLIKLKENGFNISIDDFGTGFSSFDTIAKHNIDELKIDKSLIDIIDTPKGFLICKHTTNLCHELNIKVVAEGVESENQVNTAKKISVDFIQGFFYSKVIPFDKVMYFDIKHI